MGRIKALLEFQSALPRGERQTILHKVHHPLNISIRAPAWGATKSNMLSANAGNISIRAPAWGATCCCQNRYDALQFQSALPRGERLPCRVRPYLIHRFQSALPRGERPQWDLPSIPPHKNFNPRSRVGSDIVAARIAMMHCNFNPRSRVGSDRIPSGIWTYYKGFQSALPRGERHAYGDEVTTWVQISIRAPAWGATDAEQDLEQRRE